MPVNKINRFLVCVLALLFAVARPVAATDVSPKDVDIGRQSAAEIDKEVKLVTDQAIIDRVNTIGQAVAKAAGLKLDVKPEEGKEKPDLAFTFKVIDDKEVNAFALPGGWIYVDKGLLDYVQSDDELAAVLAHETGHIIHSHGVKRQQKYERGMETIGIATLLAMILAGDKSAESIWGLSTAAQYVNLMRTLEYSQQSEFEADQDAVQLLRRTPYRPVAMLTLLERFARDAERQVGPTIAFIQTHPPSRERVEQVEATLKSLGIATVTAARRAVTKVSVATSEEVTVGDQKLWRVMLNGHEILTVAATDHGSSADRAKQIADAINAALDVGMRPYEVAGAADGSAIIYRGEPIFPLAIQDAALAPGVPSLPDLAAKVAHNLQYAIEKGLIADL